MCNHPLSGIHAQLQKWLLSVLVLPDCTPHHEVTYHRLQLSGMVCLTTITPIALVSGHYGLAQCSLKTFIHSFLFIVNNMYKTSRCTLSQLFVVCVLAVYVCASRSTCLPSFLKLSMCISSTSMKLPCFFISSCVLLLKSPATAMTVKLTPGLVFLREQLSSCAQTHVFELAHVALQHTSVVQRHRSKHTEY